MIIKLLRSLLVGRARATSAVRLRPIYVAGHVDGRLGAACEAALTRGKVRHIGVTDDQAHVLATDIGDTTIVFKAERQAVEGLRESILIRAAYEVRLVELEALIEDLGVAPSQTPL